jgi:hypothetical protein
VWLADIYPRKKYKGVIIYNGIYPRKKYKGVMIMAKR